MYSNNFILEATFLSFPKSLYIIFFSDILTENFYKEKKSRASDEAERIVLAAAKLMKNAIKNHDHATNVYPTIDENLINTNENVPHLLKVFVRELIKLPLKTVSISEAIFAAARPRTLMPIQLGLSIFADNEFASKRLIMILYKLGFAVSYDEVSLMACL